MNKILTTNRNYSLLYFWGKYLFLMMMTLIGLYQLGILSQPKINVMWGWKYYYFQIALAYISICGVLLIIEYMFNQIELTKHIKNPTLFEINQLIKKNIGLIILNWVI